MNAREFVSIRTYTNVLEFYCSVNPWSWKRTIIHIFTIFREACPGLERVYHGRKEGGLNKTESRRAHSHSPSGRSLVTSTLLSSCIYWDDEVEFTNIACYALDDAEAHNPAAHEVNANDTFRSPHVVRDSSVLCRAPSTNRNLNASTTPSPLPSTGRQSYR